MECMQHAPTYVCPDSISRYSSLLFQAAAADAPDAADELPLDALLSADMKTLKYESDFGTSLAQIAVMQCWRSVRQLAALVVFN